MLLCQDEAGAIVADEDGHEFHLPTYRFKSGNDWGVLGGLFLMLSIATEVSAESDLD